MKNFLRKKWGIILLMIIFTLAIATPVLADDGGPTADQVNDLTLSLNIFWMIMGQRTVDVLCYPLKVAFYRNKLSGHVYFTDVAEPFMTYIRVSMILAFATASPWLLYQVWKFVAAGLYAKERKYITKYLPLSITLLIVGMVFLYFYVLPLMLQFFMIFHIADPMTLPLVDQVPTNAATKPVVVPFLKQDPVNPPIGSLWFDVAHGMLKFKLDAKETRIIDFGTDSLTTPIITLGTYIDMVMGLLLSFGLAFQMPLIVLALNKIGIMDIATLKKWRQVVYFSMSILAACIVPDVATGMVALLIPLILLYEMGILLAQYSAKKAKQNEAQT